MLSFETSFAASNVRSKSQPAVTAVADAGAAPATDDTLQHALVSPQPSASVTSTTFAAIQDLPELGAAADNEKADTRPLAGSHSASQVETKSWEEWVAESRRWERYYAHQPRRLADLLAVYYGSQQYSVDPRGPSVQPLADDAQPDAKAAPSDG